MPLASGFTLFTPTVSVVWWLPSSVTVSNIAAPTRANLTAGTNLTDTQWLQNISGGDLNPQTISVGRVGSGTQATLSTGSQINAITLQFGKDQNEKATGGVESIFTDGGTGILYVAWGGDVATQIMTGYNSAVISQAASGALGQNVSYQVNFSVSQITRRCVIPT